MPSDAVPPFGRPPKPMLRGKRQAAKKPELPPDIDPFDVFEVALDANAGSDSSEDSSEAFYAYIKLLEKPKLGRLQKLVVRIQRKVFDSEEEEQRQMTTCRMIVDEIDKRGQESAQVDVRMKLRIKRKLDKLAISDLRRSPSGRVQEILIGEQWVSVAVFVRQHFKGELGLVRRMFEEGVLIRQHRRQRPETYVEKVIGDYLNETVS